MKRREAVKLIGGTTAGLLLPISARAASESSIMITRSIPSSGEKLPVIGLGTWSVFDVDLTPANRTQLAEVLSLLVKHGGRVVGSSPMYRRAGSGGGELARPMHLLHFRFICNQGLSR